MRGLLGYICAIGKKRMRDCFEALSHLAWHSWCPRAEMLPFHQAECLHLNFLLGTSFTMCYQPNCGLALSASVNLHRLNHGWTAETEQL